MLAFGLLATKVRGEMLGGELPLPWLDRRDPKSCHEVIGVWFGESYAPAVVHVNIGRDEPGSRFMRPFFTFLLSLPDTERAQHRSCQ